MVLDLGLAVVTVLDHTSRSSDVMKILQAFLAIREEFWNHQWSPQASLPTEE